MGRGNESQCLVHVVHVLLLMLLMWLTAAATAVCFFGCSGYYGSSTTYW